MVNYKNTCQVLAAMYEEVTASQTIGKIIGFILSATIFSATLFLILTLTNHLPASWNYLYVFAGVLSIGALGLLVQKALR